MSSPRTVLVYDDAIETSEVLAAVYQPRGFEVHRRTSLVGSADRDHGKAVVVLRSHAAEHSPEAKAPLKVLIGRVAEETPRCDGRRVAACRLSSLFDYRELVSAIDRLLCGSD